MLGLFLAYACAWSMLDYASIEQAFSRGNFEQSRLLLVWLPSISQVEPSPLYIKLHLLLVLCWHSLAQTKHKHRSSISQQRPLYQITAIACSMLAQSSIDQARAQAKNRPSISQVAPSISNQSYCLCCASIVQHRSSMSCGPPYYSYLLCNM